MSTVPVKIRIEEETLKEASALFAYLGLDMPTAINLFLRHCVLHGGLPFDVKLPRLNEKTLQAMEEAKRIARDDSCKSYADMEELRRDLLA